MIPAPRALLAESDIVLRDGSTLHLRPFARDDAALVRDLLDGLSADSLAPSPTPTRHWLKSRATRSR